MFVLPVHVRYQEHGGALRVNLRTSNRVPPLLAGFVYAVWNH